MDYKPYAKSGKNASRIGFGGWQLGNREEWGDMSFSEGVNLVREAIALGVNLFDTAPNYGRGISEKIIGEAIKNHREAVIVNSKFGHSVNGSIDFSLESMENTIKESLERLNTSYLDSIVLHNPGLEILSGATGHFHQLSKLKKAGLIRAFGVSIDTKEELDIVLQNEEVEVIEILFNLFFQEPRQRFDEIRQRSIALMAKVPLDSGWLTGKYHASSRFSGIRARWDQDAINRRSELLTTLKNLTKENTLTETALAFILAFDSMTAVIPGIKNSDQLKKNVHAINHKISETLKQQLIDFYEQEIKPNPLHW